MTLSTASSPASSPVVKYPLVEQRAYGPPASQGRWLGKRLARTDDDLPRLAPHQVLVYRSGDDYVEDSGVLRPDDGIVVAASSVTVVDLSSDVPVNVEMQLPSAEAGHFTLRLTCHCTVKDARAVVRDGVTDIEALLLRHLRAIPGLLEEGSDLPILESAEVRRRVEARLTAYLEMETRLLSGLRVLPFVVDVLTPEELAAHVREVEAARRARMKARVEEELEREQAEADAEKRKLREKLRRDQALIEELNRQEFHDLRTTYERQDSATGQRHELTLDAERRRFTRDETERSAQQIGNDPIVAYIGALERGEITGEQLAAKLREAEERRSEREQLLLERERDFTARRDALAREEARFRLERGDRIREVHRRDEREDAAARRQEEMRRWQLEREDTLRRRVEEREDTQTERQEQRDWRERVLDAQHDLTKRLIDRGHADDVPVNVGALINGVGETSPADAPGLDGGGGDGVPQVVAGRVNPAPGTDTAEDPDGADDLGPAGREDHRGH